MNEDWTAIVDGLRADAQRMHEAREATLARCRILIQISAKCIRHMHRGQFDEARALLRGAKDAANAMREPIREFPEIYYAGYLQDAEKELVEAAAVYSMITGEPFPVPSDLGVGFVPFLHGMGEAASEVRRYALDELRKGRADTAEAVLVKMETIYDDLITFDFPDGMTGGLRRTTDALRAVIERTRSDLTATAVQHRLIQELEATRKLLPEIEL
ncbi:MAG: haloacid dehalogenase [Fimbriimonadaceae bacterium]